MSKDLRGFSHPAAALRELVHWRLGKAERRLAQAQLALDEAQAALDQTGNRLGVTVRAMAAQGLRGLQGETHALHVNSVIRLLDEQRRQELARDECQAERDAHQRVCVELRQRIQGLDRVHEQALAQHVAERERLQWRNLDDQIITRRQWLGARSGTMDTGELRYAD